MSREGSYAMSSIDLDRIKQNESDFSLLDHELFREVAKAVIRDRLTFRAVLRRHRDSQIRQDLLPVL